MTVAKRGHVHEMQSLPVSTAANHAHLMCCSCNTSVYHCWDNTCSGTSVNMRLLEHTGVVFLLQTMAKRDHAKKMQSMREWTDDELRMLDKAVKKFPMGTPKRWEQVRVTLAAGLSDHNTIPVSRELSPATWALSVVQSCHCGPGRRVST
jgi:hypothetical protein